jgi:hypothetical protein
MAISAAVREPAYRRSMDGGSRPNSNNQPGARPLRRVALLAVLALAASGCFDSSADHAELTASEAVSKAKADGFVNVTLVSKPPSMSCQPNFVDLGPHQTTGRDKSYTKTLYQIDMNDPKVHAPDVAGGPLIVVLPSAADAARCAASEIGEVEHPPLEREKRPYKLLDAATIVVSPHPANSPGQIYAKSTGDYQIFLSRGRVLALGEVLTQPDAAKLEADAKKLVGQIAGS